MTGRPPKYNWDVIRQLAATSTPLPAICQQVGIVGAGPSYLFRFSIDQSTLRAFGR